MYYEIMKKLLKKVVSGKIKAECIFCGKHVSWSDYFCLCKEHGEKYYKIRKIFRTILPKIIIKKMIGI